MEKLFKIIPVGDDGLTVEVYSPGATTPHGHILINDLDDGMVALYPYDVSRLITAIQQAMEVLVEWGFEASERNEHGCREIYKIASN